MNKTLNYLHRLLTSSYSGWIWLSIILLLIGLKLWMGVCTIWLCGLFIGTVVAYSIFTNKLDS